MFGVKHFLLLPAAMLIIACSPKGADPTQVELSELVGLWDSSEKKGAKTDLIYTRVSSEGAIIEYDFDGDEVDAGLNRFLVTTDMHADKKFEVEIEWLDAGNALKIYFLDKKEPGKISRSQIWTRVADESILDNEPSCRR